MYRVFCESVKNYLSQNTAGYRYNIAKPLALLADPDQYAKEMDEETELYKQTSDLLWFMNEHKEEYPRFSAFLWTLESRNIKPQKYNAASICDLDEQAKLINMMLKLVYWDDDRGVLRAIR